MLYICTHTPTFYLRQYPHFVAPWALAAGSGVGPRCVAMGTARVKKPTPATPKRRKSSESAAKVKAKRPAASPQTGRAPRGSHESLSSEAVAPGPVAPKEPPSSAQKEAQKETDGGSSRPEAEALSASDLRFAFLRLSADCRPSTKVSPLIYFNKEALSLGRMPSCDVQMDSSRFPQMISRQHARLVTRKMGTPQQEWAIHDCKSLNGVTVNGEAVGEDGRTLRAGDVVNFGKRSNPPEFEFIFEAPQSSGMSGEMQMKRIADLEEELKRDREAKRQASQGLKVSELSSELACCVCKDWLVHAATIQCSHSFCWSCIDRWLQTKQFICPVCRKEVTREPVRTRAVDQVVQKTVLQTSEEEKAEFAQRVKAAEEEEVRDKKHLAELEHHISEALKAGKKFFHIAQLWGKKDKETFKKGVGQYAGNARVLVPYSQTRNLLQVDWNDGPMGSQC
eukprot:s2327_g3.t1